VNKLRFLASGSVADDSSPRLVSVLSGKGGVGKSVISFNLAERMSSLGHRILMVDADVTGGNLHILANCACHIGLAEFAEGRLSLAECVTPITERVDLLGASSSRIVSAEYWTPSTVAGLLDRLRCEGVRYDAIIIDHSSGRSDMATLIAHGSDLNLIVVVPELTSIADGFGLLKHLQGTPTAIDCCLLVNRAQNVEEADYLHKKFGAVTERFIGRAPHCIGFVLEDELVRQSVAAQSPLVALNSNSVAVQSLSRIAQSLLRDLRPNLPVRRIDSPHEVNETPAAADIRE